ncbi:MAG: B12-binding domain-containing radical SAM protein [Desulfobacteraceae bacterium]|nr:B12-binding domain-containing radical SAM protein [Desulfobacteraceae bacterium]
MAAFVERINDNSETYFVSTNINRSVVSQIMNRYGGRTSNEIIDEISTELADGEIIGFSSMTGYSDLTKAIINRVKKISPASFVIWGGIHPIVDPEDAILADVDAICTGEGEHAFQEFLDLFKVGKDFTNVKNFWFKKDGNIIHNDFRPLMSAKELNDLPFPKYGEKEKIFKPGKGFVQVKKSDYLASNGLAYHTIWAIGCPFHCSYCSNTKFIENDSQYRKIRHSDPKYIIEEIKQVIKKHPHVSAISFHDDSFVSIKMGAIKEFAELWHDEIKIPFTVYGVHPNYISHEKIEILTWAGLNRIRMGIQSGSERILKFYRRPTSIAKIEEGAAIISKFSKYHIPPAYDIIVDNPIETRQDVIDTLELLYRLPRPYMLNLFSLKAIPNTELERELIERGVDIEGIKSYYLVVYPTIANILFYLITVYKPPRWIFDRLLKKVRAFQEPQKTHPFLLLISRLMYIAKHAFAHLRFMNFSVIVGKGGYFAWRLGIVNMWNKYVNPKLTIRRK